MYPTTIKEPSKHFNIKTKPPKKNQIKNKLHVQSNSNYLSSITQITLFENEIDFLCAASLTFMYYNIGKYTGILNNS